MLHLGFFSWLCSHGPNFFLMSPFILFLIYHLLQYAVLLWSSERYGNLYRKFLWKLTVETTAIWKTWRSVCSSDFSTGLASISKKLVLLLNCAKEWQRTMKFSTILSDTSHFLSFQNILSTSGVLETGKLVHYYGISKQPKPRKLKIELRNFLQKLFTWRNYYFEFLLQTSLT